MLRLGERIKKVRVSRGLTQIQLAEMVDIDVSMITKIETGAAKPSLSLLERIAVSLSVTCGFLLDGGEAAS